MTISRGSSRSRTLLALSVAIQALAIGGCTGAHGRTDAGTRVDAGRDAGPGWEPCIVERADHVGLYTPDLVSNVEVYDNLYWQADNRYSALTVVLSGITPRAADGSCLPSNAALVERVGNAIASGMSLVRLRDGAIVPASPRSGFFDLTGAERAHESTLLYSLVPDEIEALEEGWYVFRVDLSPLHAMPELSFEPEQGQAREGSVLYARIYKGSRPMWRLASAECSSRDSRCTIGVALTESLSATLSGTVSVRYDGSPVTCTFAGAAVFGISVECPYTAHSEHGGSVIEVDFVSTAVVDPSGRPLTTDDGVAARIEPGQLGHPDPNLGLALVRGGGS